MDIDTSKRPVITKSGVGLAIDEDGVEFSIYPEVFEDTDRRVEPNHEEVVHSVILEDDSQHIMIHLSGWRGAGGDAHEQFVRWERASMPSNAIRFQVKETPVHYQVIEGRGIRVRLPKWFFVEQGTAATT